MEGRRYFDRLNISELIAKADTVRGAGGWTFFGKMDLVPYTLSSGMLLNAHCCLRGSSMGLDSNNCEHVNNSSRILRKLT